MMAGLRSLIAERGLLQIMVTHSPLSARLAEEAGFDGLWAVAGAPPGLRNPC